MKKYFCNICEKEFKNNNSFWNHKKRKHKNMEQVQQPVIPIQPIIQTFENKNCIYCGKELSNKFSKLRHEKTCSKKKISIIEQKDLEIKKLKEKLEKNRIKSFKVPQKNITKNINNNITYNIDNSVNNNTIILINNPGSELVSELNESEIEMIFSEEVGGIFKLIEFLNFNERLKQNHNFCVEDINKDVVSVYNPIENQIDKKRDKYFLCDMITSSTKKLNVLYQKHYKKLSPDKRKFFREHIDFLENLYKMDYKNKLLKSHIKEFALMSHNKRNIVKETWNQLSIYTKKQIEEYKKEKLKEIENNDSQDKLIKKNQLPQIDSDYE